MGRQRGLGSGLAEQHDRDVLPLVDLLAEPGELEADEAGARLAGDGDLVELDPDPVVAEPPAVATGRRELEHPVGEGVDAQLVTDDARGIERDAGAEPPEVDPDPGALAEAHVPARQVAEREREPLRRVEAHGGKPMLVVDGAEHVLVVGQCGAHGDVIPFLVSFSQPSTICCGVSTFAWALIGAMSVSRHASPS